PPATSRQCRSLGSLVVDDRVDALTRDPRYTCTHLTPGRVVLARELPRRLARLRTTGHEEEAVEITGRQRCDLGRELDRAWMRVRPVRVERQLAHRPGRSLADLLAVAVADVDGKKSREGVEVALAFGVLEVAPVAADDDRHLAVAAHAREVQPEVFARSTLQIQRLGRSSRQCSSPTRVPQS